MYLNTSLPNKINDIILRKYYNILIKHFQLILIIQHHIKNEHYWRDFCSPLWITFKQTFTTHSHHPISHQNEHYSPDFCSPLWITFKQTFSTHSRHPISHKKRTLLITLLFTSLNHFQTSIFNSFSSSNITSKTNITHNTSVHLFESLSNKHFQLILIVQQSSRRINKTSGTIG